MFPLIRFGVEKRGMTANSLLQWDAEMGNLSTTNMLCEGESGWLGIIWHYELQ